MRTVKQSNWIPVAVLALATLTSAAARAEYRCATPGLLTYGEVRACELARRDTPDALIHYVNRTQGTYGLYVPDYVGDADAERWDTAREQKAEPTPATVAKASRATNGDSKTD
jgi:hypothetical protein